MNRSDAPNPRGLFARWFAPTRVLPIRRCDRVRLLVESLEDRAVPTSYVVTNTSDSGAGSLRQAVTDATASGTDDTVDFSALFSTPQTITLNSQLPLIAAAGGGLSINGPGASLLTIRAAATGYRTFDSTANSLTISG